MPIIVQERVIKNLNCYTEKNKSIEMLGEIKSLDKYIIPDNAVEKITKKYDSYEKACLSIMTKRDKNLESTIETAIGYIEKQEHIEAIMTLTGFPSLEYIAQKHHIKVIYMGNGPISFLNYNTQLGYFQFTNKFKNENTLKYFEEFKKQKHLLFSREELLALFLNKENIDQIRYLYTKQHEIEHDLDSPCEGEINLDKISFLTFYCYTPYDLIFDLDYIRWRLTNPTINEVYDYNFTYIIKKRNINIEVLSNMKNINRLKYILEKRGDLSNAQIKETICQVENNLPNELNFEIKKSKLLKMFPTKKLKRIILNKSKFSNKMGTLFLRPLKVYQYCQATEKTDIAPTLYTENKMAINIDCPDIDLKNLNLILDKILFPFDLYLNKKVKIKKDLYLNEIYYNNLFKKPQKIKDYNYIVNIRDLNDISFFSLGFFESVLTILTNGTSCFINASRKCDEYNSEFLYNQDKTIERLALDHNLNLFDLYNNYKIQVSKNFIFNTAIFNDADISLLTNLSWKDTNQMLLFRYLYIVANNPLKLNYNDYCFQQEQTSINIVDYFSISQSSLYNKLKNYDTITFDIFDTLVTRTILNPDDIFEIIEEQSPIKFKQSFRELRKQAEVNARQKLKRDVNLDDIYLEFGKINNLSENQIEQIKNLEIATEIEHIIPRQDMINLYNTLYKAKNIDIISDMYLPKSVITKILEKCKIKGYRRLLISCEENKRKDNGELWDFYFKNNIEKTIHIGDNYYSDYLKVLSFGREAIKILTSNEFLNNYYVPNLQNINDSIAYGYLYHKFIFNSPFITKEEIENNLKLYGQYFLAPIFATFFDWFQKENSSNYIMFVSREGYYLQKIYNRYCQLLNVSEVENTYFLTSRRASSLASCKNIDDLLELLDLGYEGSIFGLFKNRYNFLLSKEYEDKEIFLPNDKNKKMLIPLVKKYAKDILDMAAIENQNYLKYIKETIPNLDKKKLCIVDLGYSGTTQYYLSKMLDIPIEGYYFALTNNLKPQKLGCKIVGCFNKNDDKKYDEDNYLYKKSLFLESFLSSPDGQLINFDNDGNPTFCDGRFNKSRIKYLDEIYSSILTGMENICQTDKINFSLNVINNHYAFVCEFLKKCHEDSSLSNILVLDDNFSHDGKELINLQKM